MGNGNTQSPVFWLPNDCKAQSDIVIELDHYILQRILNVEMCWKHNFAMHFMQHECSHPRSFTCTPVIWSHILSHLYGLSVFRNILILINGTRGQRKSQCFFFFNLTYTLKYIIAHDRTAISKKSFFSIHLIKWRILNCYQDK